MGTYIGVDVGAVSVKAALMLTSDDAQLVEKRGSAASLLRKLTTPPGTGQTVFVAPCRRTRGRPLDTTHALLAELLEFLPTEKITGLSLTGSGSRPGGRGPRSPHLQRVPGLCARNQHAASGCADRVRDRRRNEPVHPPRTRPRQRNARHPGLRQQPGDCAAGTGAFLDQQASRLQFAVEDIGALVEETERAAQIAGRCSVFAKSDMIHAQQKGFAPAEVLRGLCNAVATNFRSAVVKGRTPVPPVVLLGGVSANSAVVRGLCEVFEFGDGQLRVPEAAESLPAVGAAASAADVVDPSPVSVSSLLARLTAAANRDGHAFGRARPLSLERVTLLRDRIKPYELNADQTPIDAYLGLDIGSVGTKLVLIDTNGDVIHSIFTRTEGRPIEVVTRCLREMEAAVGWGVQIRAVGSTGSGRELIGQLVGADSINDEITAHKTGATFVGDRLLGKRPDTIFEIGGQDSKYISLEAEPDTTDCSASTETVVVDFTMNEACAAGTGSFLEERAEELGVAIKDEFAAAALSSRAPIRLGERCTVFMERDVNTCMQRGAQREDVIAGLAYSIAYNYINRVVRGRKIGDCIFFQGGTAYNDAVAAAFSMVCNKEIIVPPHNAVLGAIGAALLAKEKIAATGMSTRFRGYDLSQVEYQLREFTCQGCGNLCSIQEFSVEGEKTFWGDKCSDRYRKQAKTDRKPVIPDLVALHDELLHADDDGDPPGATRVIGIPLAMYTYDLLPLWRRFFRDCGFKVVLSKRRPIDRRCRPGWTTVSSPSRASRSSWRTATWRHLVEAERRLSSGVPNLIYGHARATIGTSIASMCPWGIDAAVHPAAGAGVSRVGQGGCCARRCRFRRRA